ncbi:MAG: hypothetical protein AAFY08_16570, partial [Planctomycetota bacterium]
LIELFGGPSTPAVGFGMGDVVLSLLLDDRGLLPQGADLLDALSAPPASLRPDAFVVAANDEAAEAIPGVLTDLRRTTSMLESSGVGLHARRSAKSTRNVGKLLREAAQAHARFAVILESPAEASVKDLASGEQRGVIDAQLSNGSAGEPIDARVEIDDVPSGSHVTLPMFCDQAPFDDVNVRLALK